jgi:DNA-binding NarL/FixJ family response regulator
MSSTDRSAVVLDKHPLWLLAIEDVLKRVGIKVVARATAYEDVLAHVQEHNPDVLIAGFATGGQDETFQCVRDVTTTAAGLKTVLLGDGDDPDQVEAAFSAGADVYCVRTAHPEDIALAIRQVFERSIFTSFRGNNQELDRTRTVAPESLDLTRRELEILQLVAEGHSNAQLARMLWVTEQTIKFHLSNIYRKLQVANRTEAARWAQVHGLLSVQPAKVA